MNRFGHRVWLRPQGPSSWIAASPPAQEGDVQGHIVSHESMVADEDGEVSFRADVLIAPKTVLHGVMLTLTTEPPRRDTAMRSAARWLGEQRGAVDSKERAVLDAVAMLAGVA